MGIVHPQQHLLQPCHQLGDVLRALRQEIFGLNLRRIDHFEMVQDDLQRPWKTWVLPLTCRKSPGSNSRARLSVAFQGAAPTVPVLSRSSRFR